MRRKSLRIEMLGERIRRHMKFLCFYLLFATVVVATVPGSAWGQAFNIQGVIESMKKPLVDGEITKWNLGWNRADTKDGQERWFAETRDFTFFITRKVIAMVAKIGGSFESGKVAVGWIWRINRAAFTDPKKPNEKVADMFDVLARKKEDKQVFEGKNISLSREGGELTYMVWWQRGGRK